MLPDRAAAEDVTQVAFLKLWANPQAFRGGNFGGWLARVARNCALDVLRGRAVRREEIAFSEALEPQPDHLVLSQIDCDDLRRALGRLPREQRELIEMGFFGDVSHAEIARITMLSLGTVKTRIRTGLQRLRRELERRDAGPDQTP